MKLELISPDPTTILLQKKLLELKEALEEIRKNKKNLPKGHLRVAQKGCARPQYYQYTSPDDLTGKYIRKKNISFAKTLAQKDYNEDIIPLIQKEIAALEEYLTQTSNGNTIVNFYENLCPARRELITPVTLTEEQYAALWKDVSWTGRPFAPDAPSLFTAHGERVRSKSEVIIADTLFRHSIPYRYEFPLTLKRGGDFDRLNQHDFVTLHPDFLCLNIHTRQEFFWENFGLMDDPEYSKKAAGKLRLYTENGILPGRNLIITMETQSEPLSTRTLETIIQEFLQ